MSIYDKLRDFFCGKSVVIAGFGREGRSTLELLRELDCCKKISVADKNPVEGAEGCEVYSGEGYLSRLDEYDIIMKAPGLALKNTVSEEIKSRITCQADLFLRYCPTKVIGVTGTKGKSTTSSLIYHFLSSCGKRTMLIGNIGVPPLMRAKEFEQADAVVCELSCHQLEYVKASPDIAVLLNVFPEHLDHYVDFDDYRSAKLNIFRYQGENDTLIINDGLYKELSESPKAHTVTAGISAGDIGTRDGGIFLRDMYYPADRIDTRLKGEHNLYNIAISLYAAKAAGCDPDECLRALGDFSPLEHRLEYVCTIKGAEYINDSISTAPETAIAALQAYPDTDTLIIGGMDRGVSYTPLAEFLNADLALKNLIILPQSGVRAAREVTAPHINKLFAEDMVEAVRLAKEHTAVRCILSPAAASYGTYKNFEERGRHYKSLLEK